MSLFDNSEIKFKLDKSIKIEELNSSIHNCPQDKFIGFVNILMNNPDIKEELIKKFSWLEEQEPLLELHEMTEFKP